MVEDFDISDLLPRHGHILQELEDGVRHILESAKVDTLVVSEFSVRHVSVISDDLADMLRRHVLFLRVDEAEFPFFRIAFRLKLLPFASLVLQLIFCHLLLLRARVEAGTRCWTWS